MSRQSLEPYKASVNIPAIPDQFDQNGWSAKVAESIEKHRIRRNQISYPIAGLPEKTGLLEFDDSIWKLVNLLDGNNRFGNVVWLRKKITDSEPLSSKGLELSLGFLNRQSQVYLNGKELGYFLYPQPVIIEIPRELARPGENVLTIRLAQPFGDSQVLGSPEQFFLSNSDHSFAGNIAEGWKANDQLESIILAAESYQSNPSFLFNGMVAPVIPYAIKGFIWYQGESNAGEPVLYEKLFQQLITDWRKSWQQGDLPFLFVQASSVELTHHFDKKNDPWDLLREAQQKALKLPKTGMVVSIDLGDPHDVHPKNKQKFGRRLALQAFKVAYSSGK
jgi:sialate O-acetylesterase